MVDGILDVPLTATGDEQFHLGVRCNESKQGRTINIPRKQQQKFEKNKFNDVSN